MNPQILVLLIDGRCYHGRMNSTIDDCAGAHSIGSGLDYNHVLCRIESHFLYHGNHRIVGGATKSANSNFLASKVQRRSDVLIGYKVEKHYVVHTTNHDQIDPTSCSADDCRSVRDGDLYVVIYKRLNIRRTAPNKNKLHIQSVSLKHARFSGNPNRRVTLANRRVASGDRMRSQGRITTLSFRGRPSRRNTQNDH